MAVVDDHPIILNDPVEAYRLLNNDDIIGIDLETSGFSPFRDRIALVQLYGDKTGTLAITQTPGGIVPQAILDLLHTGNRLFIVHNGVGFDIPFMSQNGVDIWKPRWYDTLVAETAIAAMDRRDVRVSLQASVKRRLGMKIDKDIEHGNWEREELSTEQIEYAASDVVHLPALRQAQLKKAEQSKQEGGLAMEMELVPVFAQMTINGMPISVGRLQTFLDKQRPAMEEATAFVRAQLGDINMNSPVALKRRLNELGFDFPNTKEETLTEIEMMGGKASTLAAAILSYRKPAQRLKVYKPEWIELHVTNGRVHPKFWQCSTDTTRCASSDPNGQQIPRDMRTVFGWEDGLKVVSGDYSQIEVRIAAEIAGDERMIALLQHDDVHLAVATDVFNVPPEEVSKERRRQAKAMVFTLLFGGGPSGLYAYAKRSGSSITLTEAEQLVGRFFERFVGVRRMRQRANMAAAKGMPVSLRLPSGLRRLVVGQKLRATVLLNTVVQGSAAVGIKHAMLEATKRGLHKYMSLQVHDELVLTSVPEAEAEDVRVELKRAMLDGMAKVLRSKALVKSKIDDGWS